MFESFKCEKCDITIKGAQNHRRHLKSKRHLDKLIVKPDISIDKQKMKQQKNNHDIEDYIKFMDELTKVKY